MRHQLFEFVFSICFICKSSTLITSHNEIETNSCVSHGCVYVRRCCHFAHALDNYQQLFLIMPKKKYLFFIVAHRIHAIASENVPICTNNTMKIFVAMSVVHMCLRTQREIRFALSFCDSFFFSSHLVHHQFAYIAMR